MACLPKGRCEIKALVTMGVIAVAACASAPKNNASFTMRLAETKSLGECLEMVNDIKWYGWGDYLAAGLGGTDYVEEKEQYVREKTQYYERFCAEIHGKVSAGDNQIQFAELGASVAVPSPADHRERGPRGRALQGEC